MPTSEPKIVVYRARNLVNGKCYIGVTSKGLGHRWRQHLRTAGRGQGYALHAAIRKYGALSFVTDIVRAFGTFEEALAFETHEIARLRPAYNMIAGGTGWRGLTWSADAVERLRAQWKNGERVPPNKGQSLSEEHKRRISEANKGQGLGRKGPALSEAHKQRLREANLGNTHSVGRQWTEESKRKVGDAHRGRVHLSRRGVPRSEETKQKLREANKGQVSHNKGKTASEATRLKISAAQKLIPWEPTERRLAALSVSIRKASEARKIPVQCVDDGRVFVCAQEAADFYGTRAELVRQSIKRGHRVKGLKFIDEVHN